MSMISFGSSVKAALRRCTLIFSTVLTYLTTSENDILHPSTVLHIVSCRVHVYTRYIHIVNYVLYSTLHIGPPSCMSSIRKALLRSNNQTNP